MNKNIENIFLFIDSLIILLIIYSARERAKDKWFILSLIYL